jgi:hypothetical protein
MHGAPQVDLFATRFNHELPLFVLPVPVACNTGGRDVYGLGGAPLLRLTKGSHYTPDTLKLAQSQGYHANGGSLLADQNFVFGTMPEIPAQISTSTTGMVLTETAMGEHISP